MGGWTEDNLLIFMQRNTKVFGETISQISGASQEWICKIFTNKLFAALDWTQVIDTPYVNVEYEGKGDVSSIKVKKKFCLTAKQCADIANFIAGRLDSSRINELNSFAIINYIRYGMDLRFNYIALLESMIRQSLTGGIE